MNKRTIITIDGLAATGKSSIAKALAERTGFYLLPSGAIYRALAWLAVENGIALDNEQALVELLSSHSIKISDAQQSQVQIDGQQVDPLLRTPQISDATSVISALPLVREALIPLQREAFEGKPLIAEGRDMGTVVFPDANLKFFIEVDESLRLERRFEQLKATLEDPSPEQLQELREQMRKEVAHRDARDSTREHSPTVPASDAILVDNSSETLTKTVDWIYAFVLERGLS